jgi:hypothetical protein
LVVIAFCLSARAMAHQGGAVSKADFLNPPPPTLGATEDGGISVAPYTFASADAQVTVQWKVDLPDDPTGRFSFYYLDHTPPSAVTYDQIITLASPIPEASGDNGFWVSCSCDGDAGVVCPDGGPRTNCGQTQFVWNTSGLAAGAYWLIAANFDYPYKIYSVSAGPVRVAHGGAPLPPAAIVLKPDGLFASDQKSATQWIAIGQAPLRFDVFYGSNSQMRVGDPPTPVGSDITPIVNPDGTFSWEWDTSLLPGGLYYFGVRVTDGTGQSTFTDSQLGQNVFHAPQDGGLLIVDAAASPDLRIVLKDPPPDEGCQMSGAGGAQLPLAAGLVAAALLALALRRRR